MFVDIDDLRAELRRLERKAGEEHDESEGLLMLQAFSSGEIVAYNKVEKWLADREEV